MQTSVICLQASRDCIRRLSLAILLLPLMGFAAAKMTVVPKWHRFDYALKSSIVYTNPLQSATLTARFVGPLGDVHTVLGFWDGDRTWRVRFAPDQPGEWHFETTCSDAANSGLNGQRGSLLCSAAIGGSRFEEHGPVRVARDHEHLEHADGTPFFWLADTVWNGALLSEPKEWDAYTQIRASQRFTAAQWAVTPGEDYKGESPITGFPEQVGVNPEAFRRLDAKVDMLSHAGLLSAILPILELQTNSLSLHEDQAVLFIKYVVARYGADPVVWLHTLQWDYNLQGSFNRWRNIGQSAYSDIQHAPLIAFSQKASLTLLLGGAKWVDIFAGKPVDYMTEAALRVTLRGATRHMMRNGVDSNLKIPERPRLVFTPCENARTPSIPKEETPFDQRHLITPPHESEFLPDPPTRFSAADVRRAAYWGLLMAPPAGVSYGAQGVINWDRTVDETKDKTPGANLPLWQRSLFMPGAKQMSRLEKFFSSIPFWRLEPLTNAIANQPGNSHLKNEILAAGTETKDLMLVYVPEDRTLELNLDVMPPSPVVTWFNPRTGDANPAVAVVVSRTCQFPTPEPGDWLLVVRGGK